MRESVEINRNQMIERKEKNEKTACTGPGRVHDCLSGVLRQDRRRLRFHRFRSSTPAATGEFDWRAYEGTELNVLFSEHTYADAVKAKLNDFQDLTGIKVNLTTMPESNYYEKLNVELASKSGSIDVFMTGAISLGVCHRRLHGAPGGLHREQLPHLR